MVNIKVVIGGNFGDEGKGLMADYFCHQSSCKSLVVCSNGGAQRGHTVERVDGKRHEFHHFGSGVFEFADTYLPEQYLVNPLEFCNEYDEIEKLFDSPFLPALKTYINPNCQVTTPFDMMLNIILEEHRDKNRHGSCGMGIFETIHRGENGYRLTVSDFLNCDTEKIWNKIKKEYIPFRIGELNFNISDEWLKLLNDDNIYKKFLSDFNFMIEHSNLVTDEILHDYNSIIFENAQGLLLDRNNAEYFPHLTPSNTGIKNPYQIITKNFKPEEYKLEICYVTRTYMTRHGAGRFDTECPKEGINKDMYDKTNVPNPYQETLRYGMLDSAELLNRIEEDLGVAKNVDYTKSLAITHANEYPVDNALIENFDGNIYISDERTCLDVRELKSIPIS